MSDPFLFVLRFVLQVAALLFLLRFVLQAVRASFYNPFCEGIVRFTDPVLRPLRSVLRPYRNLDLASFAMAWLATSSCPRCVSLPWAAAPSTFSSF